jgi:hypothetical protein
MRKIIITLVICIAATQLHGQKVMVETGVSSNGSFCINICPIFGNLFALGVTGSLPIEKGFMGKKAEFVDYSYATASTIYYGIYQSSIGAVGGFLIKNKLFIGAEYNFIFTTEFRNCYAPSDSHADNDGFFYVVNKDKSTQDVVGYRLSYLFKEDTYFRTIGFGYSKAYGAKIMLGIAL